MTNEVENKTSARIFARKCNKTKVGDPLEVFHKMKDHLLKIFGKTLPLDFQPWYIYEKMSVVFSNFKKYNA